MSNRLASRFVVDLIAKLTWLLKIILRKKYLWFLLSKPVSILKICNILSSQTGLATQNHMKKEVFMVFNIEVNFDTQNHMKKGVLWKQ